MVNLKTKTEDLGKDSSFVAFARSQDTISSAFQEQAPVEEAINAPSLIFLDTRIIFMVELLETYPAHLFPKLLAQNNHHESIYWWGAPIGSKKQEN